MHVPTLRRPLAAVLGVVAALALSALPPAYADGAGGRFGGGPDVARDIRTGPPGTALAWGSNGLGQLGDGSTVGTSTVPGRVCGNAPCTVPLDKVVQVAAGDGHSIALLEDGSVVGWGNNANGQLGDGTTTTRTTPVHVCAFGETAPCTRFLTGVVSVAVGDVHSFALLTDGTVLAWGSGVGGRLGDGTTTDRPTPVRVCDVGTTAPCTQFLSRVTSLATGYQHAIAARSDGSVATWGFNGNGQLGDGTTLARATPVQIELSDVVSVAAGEFHSVASRTDGTVYSWGAGGLLGIGDNDQHASPVRVCAVGQTAPCSVFLTGVKSVAAGETHSLAARADGTVVSWGGNGYGQLGDGTTTFRNIPVQVCAPGNCAARLTGVTAVAAGITGYHSLALRSDGSVRAWGDNANGQLGDGTTTNGLTPVRVCALGQTAPCTRFLEGATSIGAGFEHSIAVSRPLADLATSIAASPEPVANGGTLTYSVRVHNYGPTSADDVVLTDHLPANARYASASPSVGYCDTPPTGTTDTVTCHFGTLGRGAAATVTIAVKVRATSGGVTNEVSATSDTPDPRPGNNAATITTPVG
ncbi:RCC1 domain-containing protein [Streptomyces sp. NPDC003943]